MLLREKFSRAEAGESHAKTRHREFAGQAHELTRSYLTVLCASLGLGAGAAGAILTSAHLGLGQLAALLVIAFSGYSLVTGHGERAVHAETLADRWSGLAYNFALIQWNADLPGARERLRLAELHAEMLEDAGRNPYHRSWSPWFQESLWCPWQWARMLVYSLRYR